MEKDKTKVQLQCCRQYTTWLIVAVVSLLFIGNILIKQLQEVDINFQTIQRRVSKLHEDLEELRGGGGTQALALEQYRRKKLVNKICKQNGSTKELRVKSFIMDPKVHKI